MVWIHSVGAGAGDLTAAILTMVAILTIQWMTMLTMAVLHSPGDLAAARHLRHHNVDDAGPAPHADQHLARPTGARMLL